MIFMAVFYKLQNASVYKVVYVTTIIHGFVKPIIYLVPRVTIWSRHAIGCQYCLHYSNDTLYWHSFICACYCPKCSHWAQQNCLHNSSWSSLHFLLYHWWNESRSHNGCISGIKTSRYITIFVNHAIRKIFIFSFNFLQSVLMFASVICVGIKGSIDAGGIDKVWEIANEGGRIQFSDLRIDPSVRHTLWTQLIGGIFTFTSLYAVNQTQVIFLLIY